MIDLNKQRLLVIAPHPDDEVIGCAGLIQRIKKENGKVFVLFLTVGDTNDFSKKGASSASERKDEIKKAASFLKYDKYDIALEGNEYHLKLDLLGQKKLMDTIERESVVAIEKTKPSIVAFPFSFSYSQDHRIAAIATHAALRPHNRDFKHFVETVLSYEEVADTWTLNSNFVPNLFISLSKDEVQKKLDSIKLYKSQLREFPSTRSLKVIESLAVLRGAQASTNFAESFYSYRNVVNL